MNINLVTYIDKEILQERFCYSR